MRFVLVTLLAAAFAQSANAAEPPRARAGPFEVSLILPAAGLYAGEEMEIEFRVAKFPDSGGPAAPLAWGRIRGEIDMPSMPSMPRFDELAHREGIPGVFGVHPSFPHGGEYRLCLTILPPEIQAIGDPRPNAPYTVEFPLTVFDAAASPRPESRKIKPYLLDVTMTPRHPVAGELVDLELSVRHANSLERREVLDFDVQHERLIHLFIVRTDRTHFAHEHPVPAGPGAFGLRYRFEAPGEYRLFADVAPKDAGAQILTAAVRVGGTAPVPERRAEAPETRVALLPTPAGIPAGKTLIVTAELRDRNGRPIRDLQPWLGAMGHLLLLHEDAATFAHAHPDDREPGVGRDGRIPFLVRLPRPGRYTGWLQFQRRGKVETLVVDLEAKL